MKRREREDPCPICGHYHDYERGEPCGICGHKLDFTSQHVVHPPSVLPTEVIPGFLFLGSYDHASRSDLLRTLGIEHILNTVPSCPNLYKNSFDYQTSSTSPPNLEECFNYIESVGSKGGKVLVHCMSGTSRSAAVVAYYLMKANRWRAQQAHNFLQQKRPTIKLKQDDLQRLQEAEAKLFGGVDNGHQQHQQGGGGVVATAQPFQWSAPSNGGSSGSGQTAPAFFSSTSSNAGNPGSINFLGQGVPSSGFVFGGHGNAQEQQQSANQMME